ncbi:MAG TPA: M28 family peptidase [Gemmatimonadaceae bacterium]|nr:M28 family peptidase [Gemmatimonadaceae bacterium]
MRKSAHRYAAFAAIFAIAGSAHAQQAPTTPSEAGAAPNWDVLMRPRGHQPAATSAAITQADLATRLYIFADDSMQGRLLATPGNVKGAEYIANELKSMGLTPAGDNGTYFQAVNVVNRAFDESTRFSAGSTSFTAWTDYVTRDQGPGARSLDGAQVIYGGTWGDSASLIDAAAAAGKLVVLSVSPRGNTQGIPGSVARFAVTNRFPQAAGIAAVGLDLLPVQMQQILRQPSQLLKPDGTAPEVPTFMYITRRAAATLLGANVDSVKAGALGLTVTATPRFKEEPVEYPARNVVAMIPGSDPKLRHEFVAIGAHNDHIGWSIRPVAHDSIYVVNHLFRTGGADDPPVRLDSTRQAQVNALLADIRRRSNGASARPDSIYNGADDDGSGSVSALEIAQYFAAQKLKPKRSMLFVWHVGEEAGLYGSQWYTDHPTVPRDSIVAQLNMDMVGRGAVADNTGITKEGARYHGNPDYVQLVGSRRLSTELGDLAESVNRAEKRPMSFDYAMDANGHPSNIYCRSDHYEYARYGIPIIFFTTGGHADYHQVTDEPQYIDYDRMARVAQYVADLAGRLGNLDHRPAVDKQKPDPHGQCVQ